MKSEINTAVDQATLTALAGGIIPADDIDAGAKAVNAGPRLAAKVASEPTADLYRRGLALAAVLARENYGVPVSELNNPQLFDLLAAIRETSPAFFKQLRADVSALYLSDPQVWQRIGFPGPSADKGGYPDFDQPPADR
ncbi:MAG: gluconate 2-dehydrogenase subunit 3 family protein [Pirellulales bacterium]